MSCSINEIENPVNYSILFNIGGQICTLIVIKRFLFNKNIFCLYLKEHKMDFRTLSILPKVRGIMRARLQAVHVLQFARGCTLSHFFIPYVYIDGHLSKLSLDVSILS